MGFVLERDGLSGETKFRWDGSFDFENAVWTINQSLEPMERKRETGMNWISAKERLPDEERKYLVCFRWTDLGSRDVATVNYYPLHRLWNLAGVYTGLAEVTHWMEIPDIPKCCPFYERDFPEKREGKDATGSETSV